MPFLRSLLPQEGHLAALPCKNTLLIADTLADVRRIQAVVEALDTRELSPQACAP